MLSEKQPMDSREPQPQREAYNKYYLHVSNAYRAAKWGTVLIFTLFLIIMLLLQRDSITYDNFRYLLRDLNISASSNGAYTSLIYEEQQNMKFGVYKNGLAAAGSSGLRLYDSAGACVLTDSVSYKTPVIATGEKYILLFDAGGEEYSLFTALTCVKRGRTDGKIQCADVSDSGRYLLVTRSDETKYEITVYSAAFTELARYYRDAYVTDAVLSPDGEHTAVLALQYGDWSLWGCMTLYSADSAETVTVDLGDSFPLSARYLSNGNIAVVCDNRVVYVNAEGKVVSEYSLSSMTLSMFSISDNKVALVCMENVLGTSGRVLVLDSAGNVLRDVTRDDRITSVKASGGRLSAYITYGDTVEVLSLDGVRTVACRDRILDVIEIADQTIVCLPGGTETVPDGEFH